MKISKKYILLIYLFFYLSLLMGFYFNEDFAGGYVQDLQTHNLLISNLVAVSDSDSKQGKKIANRFDVDFFENYREMFDLYDIYTDLSEFCERII